MTTSLTGKNYYVAHEAGLLKDLRQKLPFFRRALSTRFPQDEVERLIQQTQDEFRALLPRLPYIGGKQNPLTTNLVACSWFLALYRVLQPRGLSDDEIGDLVYRVAEEWVKSSPRWIGRVQMLLAKTPASADDPRTHQPPNATAEISRRFRGALRARRQHGDAATSTSGWTLPAARSTSSFRPSRPDTLRSTCAASIT